MLGSNLVILRSTPLRSNEESTETDGKKHVRKSHVEGKEETKKRTEKKKS